MSIINDEMTAKKKKKMKNATILLQNRTVKIRKILVLAGDRND